MAEEAVSNERFPVHLAVLQANINNNVGEDVPFGHFTLQIVCC